MFPPNVTLTFTVSPPRLTVNSIAWPGRLPSRLCRGRRGCSRRTSPPAWAPVPRASSCAPPPRCPRCPNSFRLPPDAVCPGSARGAYGERHSNLLICNSLVADTFLELETRGSSHDVLRAPECFGTLDREQGKAGHIHGLTAGVWRAVPPADNVRTAQTATTACLRVKERARAGRIPNG